MGAEASKQGCQAINLLKRYTYIARTQHACHLSIKPLTTYRYEGGYTPIDALNMTLARKAPRANVTNWNRVAYKTINSLNEYMKNLKILNRAEHFLSMSLKIK